MASKQYGFVACAAANILLHISLLIPSSKVAHAELAAIFVPLILACEIYTWRCGLGAIVAIHAFWTVELLVFRNPREDFQVIHRRSKEFRALSQEKKGGEAVWKEPYPEDFGKRFWWVTKLVVSLRFNGWDTGEQKSARLRHVANPTESRHRWLFRNIMVLVACFLIMDATTSYQLFDPYFLAQAGIDAPLPSSLPTLLTSTGFFKSIPRIIRICVFGSQQYAIFTLTYTLPAVICVCFGGIGLVDDWWGGVHNWPPVMGNPLVIFESGLRGFWGRYWHQLFRVMLVDPGRALTRVFEVPPKSANSYAIQVLVAFLISSILHVFSLPIGIPGLNSVRYGGFFWIHGLCIIIEVFAGYLIESRASVEPEPLWLKMSKAAGKGVWTLGVLYCTVPLLGSELVRVMVAVKARPVFLFPVPPKTQ